MSTFRKSHFTDFSQTSPEDELQLVSDRMSAQPSLEHRHQNVASKQQQTIASNERIVHEIKSGSVPAYVNLSVSPQPEVYPLRLTSRPMEPMAVHWDSVLPGAVSPEHSLHKMDQELQRLTNEMKRLWGQSSLFAMSQPHDLSRTWNMPITYRDLDLHRLVNQASLNHDTELPRLWNQVAPYRSCGGVSAPPALEAVPKGFMRLTPDPSSLVPRLDAPWGHDVHAEAWRKKENYLIDNPLVKGSDGNSQFCLEFDLRQFNAGEINVTTEGHMLTVQAKHEESHDGKLVRREYFRQCTIPRNVDPRSIASQLTPSGILSVCAPVQASVGEKEKFDITPV